MVLSTVATFLNDFSPKWTTMGGPWWFSATRFDYNGA